jgi:diguanylate cyclase (GGDEF)-like protein/PAS domain S-box-containing protein
MAENRPQSLDDNQSDTLRAEIRRLVEANARLQATTEQRLDLHLDRALARPLLSAILNQAPELIYAKDTKGRILVANEAAARDNGLERPEALIGKTDFDLYPAAVAQGFFDIEQRIIASGQPIIDTEETRTDEFGGMKWLLTTRMPMRNDHGEIVGLVVMARNVTQRVRAERALRAEQALYRAMVDQVPDNLWVKDLKSRFVIVNRATARRMGVAEPQDLLGKTDLELAPPETAQQYFADEQRVIQSGQPMIDKEEYVIGALNEKRWISTTKVPLLDDKGEIFGVVGISRDITERRLAEEQIHFMAHHDALTGLPNRILLMDRLTQALLQAQRNSSRVTVLFIDLDNFKLVNDSLGHSAGDMLLKTVAERMVQCVRATDTVVRLGGDEFVILLIDQTDHPVVVSIVVDKIRAAVAEPISIEGQLIRPTASIGLAAFPEDGANAETLLLNADIAMYKAKDMGRDNFQFYAAEMNVRAHEKRVLQESLRTALARNEFALVYQPQVDLPSGRIFAVEALVRWHHPDLGLISPIEFIPMAEESGLIVPLGEWVLREACRQNKAWQDAGMAPITMCVNVSARQFREKNWVERVAQVLKDTALEAKYLELELTESLIMQDIDQAVATMRELQATGVQLSIDDFGTGYSSLSALKNLPVARLKIDQSFVRNLPYDSNDRNIATAVISLGQKLNMKVIAEGVETDAQLAFLTEAKCDEMQGFHFSKPVESDAIAALLKRQG